VILLGVADFCNFCPKKIDFNLYIDDFLMTNKNGPNSPDSPPPPTKGKKRKANLLIFIIGSRR
jgi:hypothetical protein